MTVTGAPSTTLQIKWHKHTVVWIGHRSKQKTTKSGRGHSKNKTKKMRHGNSNAVTSIFNLVWWNVELIAFIFKWPWQIQSSKADNNKMTREKPWFSVKANVVMLCRHTGHSSFTLFEILWPKRGKTFLYFFFFKWTFPDSFCVAIGGTYGRTFHGVHERPFIFIKLFRAKQIKYKITIRMEMLFCLSFNLSFQKSSQTSVCFYLHFPVCDWK